MTYCVVTVDVKDDVIQDVFGAFNDIDDARKVASSIEATNLNVKAEVFTLEWTNPNTTTKT